MGERVRLPIYATIIKNQGENVMSEITETTTIELKQLLSDSDMNRLRAKASRQQLSLANLVREAIETYLDEVDEDEIEDTPDEEILADFRQAWHDAMTGNVRPVEEFLNELRQEQDKE